MQSLDKEKAITLCCSDDSRQKKDTTDEAQRSCHRIRECDDHCQIKQEKKEFNVEVVGMEAETMSKYGNKRKCLLQKSME